MSISLRLLILEDSPADAELAVALLEEAGYACLWERVETREDFLKRLDRSEYDLVLADYSLPSFDGLTALRLFIERDLGIPFILISATLGEELAIESFKAGATDYVLKDKLFRLPPVVKRALQEQEERRQRRQADEALRNNEAYVRTILDNIPAFVALFSPEGIVLEVNRMPLERTGLRREEVIGKEFAEMYPWNYAPDAQAQIRDTIRRAAKGETVIGDYRPRMANDVIIECLGVFTPLRDASGTVVQVIGSGFDITERKRAEESLRKSQRQLAGIIGSAMDAIITVDHKQRVTLFNAAAETIFGCPVGEAIGESLERFIPERFRANHNKHVENFSRTNMTQRSMGNLGSIFGRRANGEEFPIEASISQLESEGQKFYTVILRDITERKRAEEVRLRRTRQVALRADVGKALAESSATLATILQACTDAIVQHVDAAFARIWTLNEDEKVLELQASSGIYTHLNGAFARVFVGDFKIGLIAQERQPHLTNDVLNDPRISDKKWAEREGMIAFAGYPLMAEDRLVGVVAMFARQPLPDDTLDTLDSIADIIAQGIIRRRAEDALRVSEAQLHQSQKLEAIGQLAGGIAHDFNNLLTVIIGYSDLALRDFAADDAASLKVKEIKNAANRAASLTRQLLAFSRKQVLQPEVLDLNSVISNVTKMLQRLIGEDVEMSLKLDSSIGTVEADPGQIEQIIMNLAVNARDAMPHGGTLTIETRNVFFDEEDARQYSVVNPGLYVMLGVSDTGTGMSKEVQEHIFEPFFTTKEQGKGTGLGLATVYGIVKQSGGNISLTSEPGQGTVFNIYLPRVEKRSQAAEKQVAQAPPPEGLETILLVEDEAVVRKLTYQILQASGYTVLVANTLEDAVAHCQYYDGMIHLLLSDVVMPKISGPELAKRLQTLRPKMKVLYMSGYTDDAIVHHGALEKGVALLQKPFTLDTLASKVREVLDTPEKE